MSTSFDPDSDQRHGAKNRRALFEKRGSSTLEQQRLAMKTMFLLADTLPHSTNIEEVMAHLATSCGELVRDAEASVLVADEKGELSVYAATSEEKRHLDEQQLQAGQGPILEVFASGEARLGVALQDESASWPAVLGFFRRAGMHTANTLPLRYHDQVVGVLDLCDPREFALSSLQLEILTILAASAGVGIGNRRVLLGKEILAEQLQTALNSRVLIEQAKGVIAAHLKVTPDQAFLWLRSLSRARNRKIHDVARLIVEGELQPEVLRRAEVKGAPAERPPVNRSL